MGKSTVAIVNCDKGFVTSVQNGRKVFVCFSNILRTFSCISNRLQFSGGKSDVFVIF